MSEIPSHLFMISWTHENLLFAYVFYLMDQFKVFIFLEFYYWNQSLFKAGKRKLFEIHRGVGPEKWLSGWVHKVLAEDPSWISSTHIGQPTTVLWIQLKYLTPLRPVYTHTHTLLNCVCVSLWDPKLRKWLLSYLSFVLKSI